jgi:hypothetical protein
MSTDDAHQTIESSAGSAPAPADEQSADPTTPQSAESRRDERYRARARAAEADRDKYRAAFEPHARREVERAVGDRLADASSLWLTPDLDPWSLLDDDLTVDAEAVSVAVTRLLTHAPSLGRRSPGSADGGARSTGPRSSSATWDKLLNMQR